MEDLDHCQNQFFYLNLASKPRPTYFQDLMTGLPMVFLQKKQLSSLLREALMGSSI